MKYTFSFNLIPKSSSYSSWDLIIYVSDHDFEKSAFKVSYSYSFGCDRRQKMQNFLWENVWKSVRNYMDVIEDILKYIQKTKTKSQNRQRSYFSPLCQLQLSIYQNRPVQLVPCFVGMHHIWFHSWYGAKELVDDSGCCTDYRNLALKIHHGPWTTSVACHHGLCMMQVDIWP